MEETHHGTLRTVVAWAHHRPGQSQTAARRTAVRCNGHDRDPCCTTLIRCHNSLSNLEVVLRHNDKLFPIIERIHNIFTRCGCQSLRLCQLMSINLKTCGQNFKTHCPTNRVVYKPFDRIITAAHDADIFAFVNTIFHRNVCADGNIVRAEVYIKRASWVRVRANVIFTSFYLCLFVHPIQAIQINKTYKCNWWSGITTGRGRFTYIHTCLVRTARRGNSRLFKRCGLTVYAPRAPQFEHIQFKHGIAYRDLCGAVAVNESEGCLPPSAIYGGRVVCLRKTSCRRRLGEEPLTVAPLKLDLRSIGDEPLRRLDISHVTSTSFKRVRLSSTPQDGVSDNLSFWFQYRSRRYNRNLPTPQSPERLISLGVSAR